MGSLRFWLFYAIGGAFFAAALDRRAAQLDLTPLVLISLTDYVPPLVAYLAAPILGLIIYDFLQLLDASGAASLVLATARLSPFDPQPLSRK